MKNQLANMWYNNLFPELEKNKNAEQAAKI